MTLPRLRSSLVRLLPLLAIVAVALLVAACAGGPAGLARCERRRAVTPDAAGGDPARAGPPDRPVQPARLAVHPDLPGLLHPPRRPRQADRQHRDRDHPDDDHHPDHPDPGLPPPDGVDEADPDARARGQGDPAPLQGRPAEAAGGPAPALRRARDQPAVGLPAGHPPDLPADPDVPVFSQGLQNFNPQAMLDVFGFRIIDLQLRTPPPIVNAAGHVLNPCLDPVAFGVNWGVPGGDHRHGRLDAVGPQPARGDLVAASSSSSRG